MPPPTITPLVVAELLVEGERWPVCVHVIDHPDARVLIDTGMTELRPEVVDMDPRLIPLSFGGLGSRRSRPRSRRDRWRFLRRTASRLSAEPLLGGNGRAGAPAALSR